MNKLENSTHFATSCAHFVSVEVEVRERFNVSDKIVDVKPSLYTIKSMIHNFFCLSVCLFTLLQHLDPRIFRQFRILTEKQKKSYSSSALTHSHPEYLFIHTPFYLFSNKATNCERFDEKNKPKQKYKCRKYFCVKTINI